MPVVHAMAAVRIVRLIPAVSAHKIVPFELGRPGKTGLHDESIMIRSAPWLSRCLQVLKNHGSPEGEVWPFNLAELAHLFEVAVAACRCQNLRPTLYSIRHGGLRGRSLNNVFRQSRWRSWSSLRRYGKEAKLQSELAKVPQPLIEHGRLFHEKIEQMFSDVRTVPPLPTEPDVRCLSRPFVGVSLPFVALSGRPP
jgi:hypothetical protein